MKKKIVILAILISCLSLLAYDSVAYFTAESIATNVITTGNVQINLVESTVDEEGQYRPFEDLVGVLPGAEISKIVQIENTGAAPAYIRVSVEKVITLAENVEAEVDLSLISYDLNMVDWIEKDGYFYYNKALEPGEKTAPLFTSVYFDATMGNHYMHGTVKIRVNAQATQSDNNGSDPLKAMGWPAA